MSTSTFFTYPLSTMRYKFNSLFYIHFNRLATTDSLFFAFQDRPLYPFQRLGLEPTYVAWDSVVGSNNERYAKKKSLLISWLKDSNCSAMNHMGNLQSGEQLGRRTRRVELVSFHRDFYSSVYVCFFCVISLGVVFFLRFYTFSFSIRCGHQLQGFFKDCFGSCLFSIPCSYSISLVGALNELCFSRKEKRLWKSMIFVWRLARTRGSGEARYVITTGTPPILGPKSLF